MIFYKIALTNYQNVLKRRPYLTQSIQTASLMIVGDLISQVAIEKKAQINYYRMLRFGSIGLMLGPTLTKWYRIVDKIGGKSIKQATIKKVALDQLVFAPFALAGITTAVSLVDGKTLEQAKNRLRNDYTSILLANYKIWPLVQLFNFSIVPLDYRVLFTQLIAIAWNTYLSWKLNKSID